MIIYRPRYIATHRYRRVFCGGILRLINAWPFGTTNTYFLPFFIYGIFPFQSCRFHVFLNYIFQSLLRLSSRSFPIQIISMHISTSSVTNRNRSNFSFYFVLDKQVGLIFYLLCLILVFCLYVIYLTTRLAKTQKSWRDILHSTSLGTA